jgi:hypothetical protein
LMVTHPVSNGIEIVSNAVSAIKFFRKSYTYLLVFSRPIRAYQADKSLMKPMSLTPEIFCFGIFI